MNQFHVTEKRAYLVLVPTVGPSVLPPAVDMIGRYEFCFEI